MNPTLKKLLPVLGPGWVVMLADLDAPSVITAIQSGMEFKAHLIIFLIVLIIPLYFVQDTSSRIGAVTGKTLGQVISQHFGHGWTVTAVAGTAVIDFAAYVGEFAGIAVAASIIGIPVIIAIIFVVLVHTLVIVTGKYKKIEIFLVAMGFLLFLFVALDFLVYPHNVHLVDFVPYVPSDSFYFLIAANIGAVIMPWMLFYHQAADVDAGIKISGMKKESWGTLQGAIASEGLMIAIVVFSWKLAQDGFINGNSVTYVASALSHEVGPIGPLIFAIALGVAGLLAMFVISMSMSYSLSDVLKMGGSFNLNFRKHKKFYSIYLVEIIPAAVLTLLISNLINLALDVMVLSSIALALPLLVVIRIGSNEKIMGPYRIGMPRTLFLYVFMVLAVGLGLFSIMQII
ncbi:MAG: divalent metal cation transporter [Candidatus Thermoplasmatota archaeon]|nr:divalent metal cation transporter [Candidatus Thermoplasmatota archaeon]